PRRLIDVRNTEKNGPVKLIETTGQEGRYLCLSHCWGEPENHPPRTTEGGHPVEPGMGFEGELDSDNVMRTLRTIDEHKEGIPWTDLSKTFQDAVSFVRALGESYIWIDSLCIIQDSPQDWAQESTKMADIYQNSYLTIAATKSSNSAGGLFNTPDSRFKEHSFNTPVPPLLQRAWVYQERVLSPRTLHFGHQEVLWECMSQTSCECSLGWSTQDLVKEWHRAVSEYSTLALTKSSDRLPAIAGIARQMQKLRRGEDYFAGLWRESCLEDLLWFHNCQQGPGEYRECIRDTRCAPSWSWACV
ncbi:heterokaryon incompatibility protein-domain-containing protein, partial [Phyllosticta capitalensis]|uniref:heterokaryon incompatibility protein-domain-containing protein n=1 Tax=Phyllosticta capitalensis TaxID=121624 RepID=UPI00312E1A25